MAKNCDGFCGLFERIIMSNLRCWNAQGKHDGTYLEEVFCSGSDDECVSIKWCSECGAVVGDVEVDGRLMGSQFRMKFPRVIQQVK